MDNRSVVFLEVMIALAAIGVLAFLAFLLVRLIRTHGHAVPGAAVGYEPQWYEFAIGLVLLAVVAALAIWWLSSGALVVWGAGAAAWPGDTRAILFVVAMAVLGALGLLAFLVLAVRRSGGGPTIARRAVEAVADDAAPAAETVKTPSAARLLGLLFPIAGFLVLSWVYLSRSEQFEVMLRLIYPAALGVALVLLFDKASRTWSAKGGAETVREWLLCGWLILLLIVGFLNLQGFAKAAEYANVFWDTLHIALFFAVFWVLDRKVAPTRFLLVYGYFALLPILLLIWRGVQGVAAPEEISWWQTIWPFFGLAAIFFFIEAALLLVPAARERQFIPAVKDVVFLVLYIILSVQAMPAAAT